MFSHPGPREEGHHFTANEVILCAENQLLAGDIRCSLLSPSHPRRQQVADFRPTRGPSSLELVAEGALIHDPEPGCLVHDTFSCLVAAKEVTWDNHCFCQCPYHGS